MKGGNMKATEIKKKTEVEGKEATAMNNRWNGR